MTAFDSCFLLLDNPRGGVEDIAYLKSKAPWLGGLFVNVRDYSPDSWATVRSRCAQHGLFCGPWGRTAIPGTTKFDPAFLSSLCAIAKDWNAPVIINCEKEIDGTGDVLTKWIAKASIPLDAALSVEAWPFDSVDWTPVGHLPILPQIFPAEWVLANESPMDRARKAKARWHERGADRVYFTFGTYGGQQPSYFDLKAPYSLFTGDPIMASYTVEQWAPTSTGFDPTGPKPPPPPSAAELAPEYIARALVPLREWEALEPGETPLTRITLARRILESGKEWKDVKGPIKAALDEGGVS